MARQIIILERNTRGSNIEFRAAFWLAVPTLRQPLYANASAKSQVLDGSVTAGELTAIQNGSVVEQVDTFQYPSGNTLASIEADLQAQFTQRQADFNADSARFQRYGSSFDGTTWTLKNIT
jgi:hypothetical protein